MKKLSGLFVPLLLVPLLFVLSSVAAAEAPAKAAVCNACHGVGGAKPIMGLYPKLNGQNKEYLASSLKAYKDGQRTGAMAAMMAPQAASLSDQDIKELSEYYSAQ